MDDKQTELWPKEFRKPCHLFDIWYDEEIGCWIANLTHVSGGKAPAPNVPLTTNEARVIVAKRVSETIKEVELWSQAFKDHKVAPEAPWATIVARWGPKWIPH